MLGNLIPPQYIRALEEGEMLLMVATPFDNTKEPIRVGFNKKALHEAKLTPNGQTWVSNAPLMSMPKDESAERIVEVMITVIMRMSKSVGGCAIDLMLADVDNTVNN